MGTFLHGIFKDKNDDIILVEINSEFGNSDITIGEEGNNGEQIYFSGDPIEITTETEDLFTHIIKRTCTINLVTSMFLGNILFAGNEKSIEVNIYKNTNCIFSGYVEPYTYSQPWAYSLEEITLNCIDKLCCLQYEYIFNEKNWAEQRGENNVLSFKDYLSMILPTSTYWDQSKTIDNKSIFDVAGVSMNVFLGKSEKDVWNNEEILEEILKYCNLHIIQEGDRMFIFDWKSIGSTSNWHNIYNDSSVMIASGTITINKDNISSDDTNLSMSDVYNKIILKCELEEKEDVLSSPLEESDMTAFLDAKHMFLSEYIMEDVSLSDSESYVDVIKQGYLHPENIVNTDSKWYRQDWYFKWMDNPKWSIYYNGIPVSNWVEKDSNGKVINQWRILRAMAQNRFMPALLWVGKNSDKINKQRPSRLNSEGKPTGSISGSNYLVISVNGNEDNSESELGRIDNAIYTATHSQNGEHVGLLKFTGESGIFSPTDENTTNYIIFTGSMVLNPVRRTFGSFSPLVVPLPYRTFTESYNIANNSNNNLFFARLFPITDNPMISDLDDSDKNHFYAQQFWTCRTANEIEQPANNMVMVYPFNDKPEYQALSYKWSDYGDETDKIDKLGILECELKIGDKYLVEIEQGDMKKPTYRWLTEDQCPVYDGVKKKTFSLGIDPVIDQPIIGKEYELANNVNARYSNEKGTAIPIKKEDALTGDLSFKILGLYNSQWNYIMRRHPTMFRHTKYYDNWTNVFSYVSSIWIKNFNIKIISDNEGMDVSTKTSKDLVYISDEAEDYIKKKDDVTFKINTMPTTEELLEIGIDSNVSNTNVVNMLTKQPLETVVDHANNETNRPERLYINEYYNFYNSPKIIVNTSLKYTSDYYFFKLYSLSGFGTLMPFKIDYDLKLAEVHLNCRQI